MPVNSGFVGKLKKAERVYEEVQEQTGVVTKDGKNRLYNTLDTIRDSRERLIYQSGSLAATRDFLQKDSPKRAEYDELIAIQKIRNNNLPYETSPDNLPA